MKRQSKPMINPLLVVAGKQRLGDKDAAGAQLLTLVHLEMFINGKSDNASIDEILAVLVQMQVIAGVMQNKSMYDRAGKALVMLSKSCETAYHKGGMTLDPSTDQRKAIVPLLRQYVMLLPQLPIKLFISARQKATDIVANINAYSMDLAA